MELEGSVIAAICGDEGTGKTTMALTFPKPLRHFDVDVGGYRRAIWRLDAEGIESKGYPKPIQVAKLLGTKTDPSASTRILIPKKVEGMKELWQLIVTDFVAACQDTAVKTVVIDSATMLWGICHNSHLQMIQERQLAKHMAVNRNRPFDENDYRERLQPIEYGPANDRMRTILHTARSYSKNLILTHYPTDEYGTIADSKGNMVEGKTGKVVLDGFKETKKLVDLVVWCSIKSSMVPSDPNKPDSPKVEKKEPVCKITKCGLEGAGLAAVGLEIPATFEGVVNLVNLLKGAAK